MPPHLIPSEILHLCTHRHWVPMTWREVFDPAFTLGNPSRAQVKSTHVIILRPAVSRLAARHPSSTRDQFLPSLFSYFYAVTDLWMRAPSLTRSRVCSAQFFLLDVAGAAVLRPESNGTQEHISSSLFSRLPQTEGSCSCIYFPPATG
jgi:hypothetical protein